MLKAAETLVKMVQGGHFLERGGNRGTQGIFLSEKDFLFFFGDFGETLLLDCGALQLALEQRHASTLTLGHILNPPIDSK